MGVLGEEAFGICLDLGADGHGVFRLLYQEPRAN